MHLPPVDRICLRSNRGTVVNLKFLAAAMMCAAVATPACARLTSPHPGLITQTIQVDPTSFSGNYTLQGFDPRWGTLEYVDWEIGGRATYDLIAANFGGPDDFTFSAYAPVTICDPSVCYASDSKFAGGALGLYQKLHVEEGGGYRFSVQSYPFFGFGNFDLSSFENGPVSIRIKLPDFAGFILNGQYGINSSGVSAAIGAEIDYQYTPGLLAPPTPEPMTWAMMLVGLGGVGAAMRRQRREVTRVQLA
jgi:hypothetical protein